MPTKKEKDAITGMETTGHEWDGIKELNTPLPRWWLYIFYATIVWALGYVIAYPALPWLNGHSDGMLGYDSREEVAQDLAEVELARGPLMQRLADASLEEISNDSELMSFALAGGAALFGENCAPCHGQGGAGALGYPALADDDWIWGGSLDEIITTLRHGIRADDPQTRFSEMPAFGDIFTRDETADLSAFVLSLSGLSAQSGDAQAGRGLFADNCAACHGEAGQGGRDFGAPNLADAIWFYGVEQSAIEAQIRQPRHGVMPGWGGRFDENTLKLLATYVHSLGGGE